MTHLHKLVSQMVRGTFSAQGGHFGKAYDGSGFVFGDVEIGQASWHIHGLIECLLYT